MIAQDTLRKLFWLLLITTFSFVNIDLFSGLYLSALLFLLLVGVSEVTNFRRDSLESIFYWPAFLFLIIFLLQILLGQLEPGEGLEDTVKVILLFVGSAYIYRMDAEDRNFILMSLPWVVALYIVFVYGFLGWQAYDPIRDRFQVPAYGSSNTLAFMLGVVLVILNFQIYGARSTLQRVASIVCFGLIAFALFRTQSRGGFLVFLVGSLFMLPPRLLGQLVMWGVAAVSLFAVLILGNLDPNSSIIADFINRGSSGRLLIWQTLLAKVFSDPVSMIVGLGPVNEPLFMTVISSAHSMVVQILYGFGLLGFFAFLYISFNLFIRAWESESRMSLALLGMILASAIVDSVFFNMRILWFNCLLFGYVAAGLKNRQLSI